MIKHPDPEIQFLVEVLEDQRDSAVANAAALFRTVKELEQQIAELKTGQQKSCDEECDCKVGGTD